RLGSRPRRAVREMGPAQHRGPPRHAVGGIGRARAEGGDMMPMTPWQVGFVSTVLRSLARNDRIALARVVARPAWPMSMFSDGVARIVRLTSEPWCRDALAPWGDDAAPGPRTY